GQTRLADDAVEREGGEGRHEEEEAPELGVDGSRSEVELPDIRNIGHGGVCSRGTILVISAGKAGKAFGLEDLVHGHGTDGGAVSGKGSADVVDGEVLLAQGNHAVTQGLFLG